MHTIYALLKIFRIDEGDPLIYQLSFTDTEIENIIDAREKQLLANRQAYREWQAGNVTTIETQYRDAMRLLRQDEGAPNRNPGNFVGMNAGLRGDRELGGR